jgi:putative ABC transport system substrate-binding protein
MPDRRQALAITLGWLWSRGDLRAQAKPRVIGFLGPYSRSQVQWNLDIFAREMERRGYISGKDYIAIERFADGKSELLAGLARDLVGRNVDLIYASSTNAVAAAKEATSTIPIVFEGVADPLQAGFVDSLARPGRNITGVANFSIDLTPKRFQLLKQTLPNLVRLGVLANPANPYVRIVQKGMQTGADEVGLRLLFAYASSADELRPAFASLSEQSAEAVLVTADAFLWNLKEQISNLALRHRLPSMHAFAASVEAGGLMSYGADPSEGARRAVALIDSILRGANPRDLPVEQPTRLVLYLNQRTARDLGVKFPSSVLVQAQTVID